MASLSVERHWLAHSLPYLSKEKHGCEVFACCWTDENANCIASGSEDNLVKLWDVRCHTASPVAQNQSHGAGVTFLGPSSESHDRILFSGSYDENLRILDTRNMISPLQELQLNGGVWNVEQHSLGIGRKYLIAACMYGGWSLLSYNVSSSPVSLEVSLCYDEQGPGLTYGVTAIVDKANDDSQPLIVASSTFNDHGLSIHKILP